MIRHKKINAQLRGLKILNLEKLSLRYFLQKSGFKLIFAVLCFSILSVSCAGQLKKQNFEKILADNPKGSEEIPERRDFPHNPKVSPCQNFYGHACSLAQSQFRLREDRSRHMFAFNDSSERILKAKMDFFEKLNSNQIQLSPRGKQLKPFYQSCMNQSARAKEEAEVVKQTLQNLRSFKTREAYLDWFIQRSLRGESSILRFRHTANMDRPLVRDLNIGSDRALNTLPERSYYYNPEVEKDLTPVLEKFFESLGLDQSTNRALSILKFEKSHMDNYPLPREMRVLWNERNLVERKTLIQKYPNLRIAEVFKLIPEKTLLRLVSPDHFQFLNDFLQTAPMEDLFNLASYLALSNLMDEAYPEYFQMRFAFSNKHLGGPNTRSPLQERCTRLTMSRFNMEVDYELVDQLFPNFPEQKFVSLLKKVKSAIESGLEKNEWLSPEGKRLAIEKIKTARFQVVKPKNESEWNFNPRLEYSENNYIENMRKLNLALLKKDFNELKTLRNPNLWEFMGPLTVNAYYSAKDNKFVMPMGILQYPFYDPSLPDHVNLGAVGAVVGHELGHGIDDQGAKYDSKGRLKQWLSDKDVENFKKRGAMLVEQFNEAGLDGALGLGENIGDFVGVTFAYQAAFPETSPGDQKQHQEFFIQYARAWCGVMRPKEAERLIKTGPHSLIHARVNEQVRQQPAFKEAFQCKAGDPMTLPPERLVKIW